MSAPHAIACFSRIDERLSPNVTLLDVENVNKALMGLKGFVSPIFRLVPLIRESSCSKPGVGLTTGRSIKIAPTTTSRIFFWWQLSQCYGPLQLAKFPALRINRCPKFGKVERLFENLLDIELIVDPANLLGDLGGKHDNFARHTTFANCSHEVAAG